MPADDLFYGIWRDADPAKIFWQQANQGPTPIQESVHYRGAVEMLAGTGPSETCYAAAGMRDSKGHTQGKPAEFAALIKSIGNGWAGKRVRVWINRRGELVLTDGMHRTAAAAATGLASIPVTVVARDEDWWRFLYALKELNSGVKLYQPVDHPDTMWPCWRKDTDERARIIGEAIREAHGDCADVIDLGCHTGTLSCALARQGFYVTGFDLKARAIEAASMMAGMTHIGGEGRALFARQRKSVPDMGPADAVVCLSAINHQWHKGHENTTGADILKACLSSAPMLILDCPIDADPVGGFHPWTDPALVIEWIGQHVEGRGRILAPVSATLQRTLILWER